MSIHDYKRTITIGKVRVEVRSEVDSDPDLSYLGKYTDKPKLPAWDRALGRVIRSWSDVSDDEAESVNWSGREYRYIEHGCGDPDYIDQDAKRLEAYEADEWRCYGIIATAYVAGVEMGESSLWGIESDSDPAYFDEVAQERAEEAAAEAEAQARKVCAAIDG